MIILDDRGTVPATARGAFLSIGNFDGVHLGHAHLLSRLRARADAAGAPAVAVTFDPHPAALLRPEAAPVPLAWTARNASLMGRAGASEVGVFRTGPWLLGLTARAFFDEIVVGRFAARGLVEGPNFFFGRDRAGDVASLRGWCDAAGLAFEVVAPSEVDGEVVSSSRVRRCVAEGRVGDAARLLGRPHRLRGVVTRGAGRGAGLGFPTANLDALESLAPGDGVYAVVAAVDGTGPTIAGACHVGRNVTFGAESRTVEVHLLDFAGDLYGRHLEVDLLALLRTSRAFSGVDDLLAQIARDVGRAREVAGSGVEMPWD